MLMLAIEGAAHGCEGIGEWKDFAADQQIVILGSDRMPKHAVRRNRHLGNQVCPRQSDALRGRASERNSPDHPVLLAHVMGVKEAAALFGLSVTSTSRRQPHPQSFDAHPL